MNISPDSIILGLFVGSVVVGGASYALSQTAWAKRRPALERLLMGVHDAAGRLRQAIPPGTTAAQAESMVAAEAVNVASNYAASAKVSGADQAAIEGMIAGALGHALPVGHIVPGAPPAVANAVDALVADITARLAAAATSTPAPAAPPVGAA